MFRKGLIVVVQVLVLNATSRCMLSIIAYENFPQRGAVWSRQHILARDRMTLVYCGRSLTATLRAATFDHILSQQYCREYRNPANTWTTMACLSRRTERIGNVIPRSRVRAAAPALHGALFGNRTGVAAREAHRVLERIPYVFTV